MTRLILASASQARAQILRDAGLSFDTHPADIDEDDVKSRMTADGAAPRSIAEELAKQKALHISQIDSDAHVLGADQILVLESELLSKAPTVADARAQLLQLRGKQHSLITSSAIARGDAVVWSHTDIAHLSVRDFSDQFLQSYISEAGEALTGSVGCYHLEGMGAQLFDRIDGDYFSILGLPLLELLGFLRGEGILQT